MRGSCTIEKFNKTLDDASLREHLSTGVVVTNGANQHDHLQYQVVMRITCMTTR